MVLEFLERAGQDELPVDASEEEQMQALINLLSAYVEYYHGGWVDLIGFDGETLQVRLGGACEGCRLSEVTLHGWVEGTVRQFFPDVKRVEAV
jgi:Fe-S cluster biogenesis protein NfuA